MKAIRIHEYGPPECLRMDTIEDPSPDVGEVLVAVAAAGVNPADYKFRNGMLAAAIRKPLPFIPGMDIAGTVVAVGDGVSDIKPGDRVLAMLYMMGNGAYAEKVSVPAEWCARVPDGLDLITAAALPTPATTAVELVEDELDVKAGQKILVIGAVGAVGLIACHVAQQRGAHVTAGIRKDQVDGARYADAMFLLDGEEPGPVEHFDCIADTIGGDVAKNLLGTLKTGGVIASVATSRFTNDTGRAITIRNFGNRPDAERLGRLAQAVASGDLQRPPIRILQLAEASIAHKLLEAGGSGKIVLTTS